MRFSQRAIPSLVVSALLACAASAQRVPSGQAPAPRMCSMLFSILTVQLVDSAHAPITGATVSVRRVRTGAMIDIAAPNGDGSYRILQDGVLKDLRRGGEPFAVTFVKGAKRRTVRVRVGMDEDRCHVRFITEPHAIVL